MKKDRELMKQLLIKERETNELLKSLLKKIEKKRI
jgi:hypothetical protein